MRRLPYVGLQPYEPADAASFCGRMGELLVLKDVYQEQAGAGKKVLVIYGPSGAGKTSIVQAGLWPIARSSGDVSQLERYEPAEAESLVAFTERVRGSLEDQLAGGENRCLVFLDQLDKLVGYAGGTLTEELRNNVMDLLEMVTGMARTEGVRFVIALREPWAEILEAAPGNKDYIEERLEFFRLGHMSPAGIEEFLRLPIRRWREARGAVSGPLDSRFFEECYADTSENPASVPLTNLLLHESLSGEGKVDEKLTYESYLRDGGLIGFVVEYAERVVANWAEEKFAKLEVFLDIFRAAAAPGMKESDRCAFLAPLVADSAGREITEDFVEARLAFIKGDRWERAKVQLCHDSLLEAWPRTALGDGKSASG